MTTTILISIYLLSGLAWYLSVRYEYTHNYKYINPDIVEFVVVFIPFINTLWAVLAWTGILTSKVEERVNKKIIKKFFRI